MRRREFLRASAAVACGLTARGSLAVPVSSSANSALTKAWHAAIDFLWSCQSLDGAWHSSHYAVLRSGQALTPFVLNTLLSVPDAHYRHPAERTENALAFLRQHVRDDGALGWDDPELPEYPCHATADAVRCLLAANRPGDQERLARMLHFLVGAQYGESHGFTENDLAYGAWGFTAPTRNRVVEHLDISHTRHVLQAIRAMEHSVQQAAIDASVYHRSLRFLQLMQRRPSEDRSHPQPLDWPDDLPPWDGKVPSFDGGFYFSPTALTANKGGWERHPPHWKSYATATADGLLALLAAGIPQTDPRVASAIQWLDQHPDLHDPMGIPVAPGGPWGPSLRYYHYAVRSECGRATSWRRGQRAELASCLVDEQLGDGSFVNRDGILMKEDDPILCTALAVKALSAIVTSEPAGPCKFRCEGASGRSPTTSLPRPRRSRKVSP